jgi:hypothetical protein
MSANQIPAHPVHLGFFRTFLVRKLVRQNLGDGGSFSDGGCALLRKTNGIACP